MKRTPINLIRDLIIVLVTFMVLGALVFPFIWVFLTSVRPAGELFTTSFQLLPSAITLGNYLDLLDSSFPRYILNSIFVVSISTLITVLLATFAAYAFSRYTFKAKGSLLATIAFSQLFPFVIILTPLYVIFWRLRLVNTFTGLIIAYIAISLPFSIYMLLGYFQSVPRGLDEAASIDGCSTLGTIFKVILPVAWPGVVATAIYTFAQSWAEFLFALTLMTDDMLKTVPVGLANFFGQYTTNWGAVMSASVVTTIPTLIFFLVLQRHLVAGLAAGAVKQ